MSHKANGLLTDSEAKRAIAACTALKRLFVDPLWFLEAAVRSQQKAAKFIPVEFETVHGRPLPVFQIDSARIQEALQTVCEVGADALRAPLILGHISSLRAMRSHIGRDAEDKLGFDNTLDRLSSAIALRGTRGRPIIPKEAETQDRGDYGVYLRIQAVMARELGRRVPTLGKLGEIALYELAFTRMQFEPFLSQQLALVKSNKRGKHAPMSHRAALVLLGLTRLRRKDPTPVTDYDLEEALSNIERLKKSLKRISERNRSGRLSPKPEP
jgi:hypothetical protein